MKTIKTTFITALVIALGLLVSVPPANAKKPQNAECDLLAGTNDDLNGFLDAEGVQFNNLGALVSSAILDDKLFDDLNALYMVFSGGEIEFYSASQVVATNAKCGLIPQFIGHIRD